MSINNKYPIISILGTFFLLVKVFSVTLKHCEPVSPLSFTAPSEILFLYFGLCVNA